MDIHSYTYNIHMCNTHVRTHTHTPYWFCVSGASCPLPTTLPERRVESIVSASEICRPEFKAQLFYFL